MTERDLLARIVAARKRMYDRALTLFKNNDESSDDLDQREIDLYEAQLRLAAFDSVAQRRPV